MPATMQAVRQAPGKLGIAAATQLSNTTDLPPWDALNRAARRMRAVISMPSSSLCFCAQLESTQAAEGHQVGRPRCVLLQACLSRHHGKLGCHTTRH